MSKHNSGNSILAALSEMKLESMVSDWPCVKIITFAHQKLSPKEYDEIQADHKANRRFEEERKIIRVIGRYSNYSDVKRVVVDIVGEPAATYICEFRLREIVRERWPDFVVMVNDHPI